MEKENLEYRMYFYVPYNISDKQKGIQATHAGFEYLLQYGRFNPDHNVWKYIKHDKTIIMLNGGTTNDKYNTVLEMPVGIINQIAHKLSVYQIDHAIFREPDLNGGLSAVAFLADERVWDREKYPDWEVASNVVPIINSGSTETYGDISDIELGLPVEVNQAGETYNQWVNYIGGLKNKHLRELTDPKAKTGRLA